MKYLYTSNMKPPGLMMPIVISDIHRLKVKNIDAELDTGGGISSIPADIAKSWNLIPFETVDARGTFGSFKEMEVYVIRIKFENGREIKAKVIKNNRNSVILGRNVLNSMILHADGPSGFFIID